MAKGVPGRLAGVAALLAVGMTAGVAAEQALLGRRFRWDPDKDEPFGLLRGEVVDVLTEDGVRLHVEVDEPPHATPDDMTIFFIHGYGLSQDSFHYQRRDLRSLGRLVFVDQRSHGRSLRGLPERSNVDQLGRDLREVIEAVSPRGPVVLVGHSMGGMTILSLASQDPDYFRRKIDGVALLATTAGGLSGTRLGLPEPVGRAFHRVVPTALTAAARRQDLIDVGLQRASDLVFVITRHYAFGSRVSPSLTQFVADMIAGTPVDVIAEYLDALEVYNDPEAVHVLEGIETLIMVGEKDLVTPPRHSHEIVRRAPHAEFVLLPDTAHMLMLERYPDVNYHLRELVARIRRQGASSMPGQP